MSQYAQPGRFGVGLCFSEAEDQSPWEPLHIERGFDPKSSTVTVFWRTTYYQCWLCLCRKQILNSSSRWQFPTLITGTWARSSRDRGCRTGASPICTRKRVGLSRTFKNYLWRKARIPYGKMVKYGRSEAFSAETIKRLPHSQWAFDDLTAKKAVRIAEKPTDIVIVVSGGVPHAHVPWLPAGVGGRALQTQEYNCHQNWKELMDTAKREGWFWSP